MSDDDIQYQYEYDNIEDQHKKNGTQEGTKEDIGVADETAGAGERSVHVEGERGVCVEGGRSVGGGGRREVWGWERGKLNHK